MQLPWAQWEGHLASWLESCSRSRAAKDGERSAASSRQPGVLLWYHPGWAQVWCAECGEQPPTQQTTWAAAAGADTQIAAARARSTDTTHFNDCAVPPPLRPRPRPWRHPPGLLSRLPAAMAVQASSRHSARNIVIDGPTYMLRGLNEVSSGGYTRRRAPPATYGFPGWICRRERLKSILGVC